LKGVHDSLSWDNNQEGVVAHKTIRKKPKKQTATGYKKIKPPVEVGIKKYIVRLSRDEREHLCELLKKGKSPAKLQLKARILLKADVGQGRKGWSDNQIIRALDTSVSMVYRVRQQLVEEGFEAVLARKQRATPPVPRIFDGAKEAKLTMLACSEAPEGQARWTLKLLANRVVALEIVPAASPSTIARALKKTS
jgi:transposase